MLNKLIIKNIALIDNAEIEFSTGLNVLSGETGAGKSVIIDSLNFVLGAKADKTLIRSGETECFVKAEFYVAENNAVRDLYSRFDIEEDDYLIISRKFSIDGKSTIKINGNTATVSMIRSFTSALVDVHGQSDHFKLLKTSNQLDLIDLFGGDEILNLKSDLSAIYSRYKNVLSELEEFGGSESTRLIRLDVLNYQINEIEKSNIYDGEEAELLEIKHKIDNYAKIYNGLSAVKSAINDEGGISDILSNASRNLSAITSFDERYSALFDTVESVFSELESVCGSADNYIDELDVSEFNPYEIEDRLELIKSLKNKYGATYSEIIDFLDKAKEEKDKLENFNELTETLQKEKCEIEKSLFSKYTSLSELRKASATEFSNRIVNELRELGMPKAEFKVDFNKTCEISECKFNSANGFDEVQFMFSANLGEPLKPLSMIISGGEISRFMLAIKAQTAKYNDVSTFIFDEIDTGISGNVAKVVAEKFAKIAVDTQIIAITHLPQISAMADNNLLIEKSDDGVQKAL